MATASSSPESPHSGSVHCLLSFHVLIHPSRFSLMPLPPRSLPCPHHIRDTLPHAPDRCSGLHCTMRHGYSRTLPPSGCFSADKEAPPLITLIVSPAPGAVPSPPIILPVPWRPSPPTAGHSHDLREGQLQKHLLLLVHEVHTRPVDSHNDVALGEGRACDSDRGSERGPP